MLDAAIQGQLSPEQDSNRNKHLSRSRQESIKVLCHLPLR
jgi:hypothetical protein